MKIALLALLLFTVGALSQSGCAKAQVRSTTDPDWKYLTKDEDDGLEWETYYDVNSVKRTTGVVAVWLNTRRCWSKLIATANLAETSRSKISTNVAHSWEAIPNRVFPSHRCAMVRSQDFFSRLCVINQASLCIDEAEQALATDSVESGGY